MKKFLITSLSMFFAITLIFFASCGGGGSGGGGGNNPGGGNPGNTINYKAHGLNFSPYKDGQNPNHLTYIGVNQIREMLNIIKDFVEWVRTFGSTSGLQENAKEAKALGLKTAIGAWLGSNLLANDQEIANLIQAARDGYVDIAIVGSEVLLRGDLTEAQLIGYINQVKNAVPGLTVTTGEVYNILLNSPNLIAACDVIFVNYYPYWEGTDISNAVQNINFWHQKVVAAAGGKEVVVSETGWPSDGNTIGSAVPSLANANRFFIEFVSWARDNDVKYFYFEAFDETWKAQYEGPQGAHWGIWDKDGNMKAGMEDVFDGKTVPNNWTCQGIPGGFGTPDIQFTYVPPRGSHQNVEGRILHVQPEDHGVVIYIYVGGRWWIKPYYNRPVTSINCDGTWTVDYTTGGVDQNATSIIAYLIPASYTPPSSHNATELNNNALAKIQVYR